MVGFTCILAVITYAPVGSGEIPVCWGDSSPKTCSPREVIVSIHGAYSLGKLLMGKVAGDAIMNLLSGRLTNTIFITAKVLERVTPSSQKEDESSVETFL